MNNYIKNMETGKIELHFDKADYMALSAEQKAEIKSAFLFSKNGSCWVSRAKEPNTWRAERVAEKLGFTGCEKVGERLSYAEQIERKADRAERRADRFEGYAENAERRAAVLQKPINDMRGDISFFTQPIIAGHSGSQAFARRREKMFAKYERGMDEYRKSGYFQDRAATARATANMAQLENPVYLDNRIRECNKNLRDYQKHIVSLEESLYKIEQGETLKSYSGDIITAERLEERLETVLDRYEAEQDKLNFMEDCLSKIGGMKFSPENIKVGYIVNMRTWGKCEIVSAGPVNVKIKTGNSVLTEGYAAIESIVAEKAAPTIENPYSVGDVLYSAYMASGKVYRAYQVIKTTDKSVRIQEIEVVDCVPQTDNFKSDSKPATRKITASKFSDYVGVYEDGRQLYKYTA